MISTKFLILLLLPSILLLGCLNNSGGNSAQTSQSISADGHRTFEDQFFSMQYPETWQAEEGAFESNTVEEIAQQRFGQFTVTFISPKESSADMLQEALSVFSAPERQLRNRSFVDEERDLLSGDWRITSVQNFTFKGREAVRIDTEGLLETSQGKVTAIYFKDKGRYFRIDYGFEASKQSKFQPIFDRMLSSMEIK